MNDNTVASELAIKFYLDYDLTYLSRIGIEETINNMLWNDIPISDIENYISNILDNIEFINKGDNNG